MIHGSRMCGRVCYHHRHMHYRCHWMKLSKCTVSRVNDIISQLVNENKREKLKLTTQWHKNYLRRRPVEWLHLQVSLSSQTWHQAPHSSVARSWCRWLINERVKIETRKGKKLHNQITVERMPKSESSFTCSGSSERNRRMFLTESHNLWRCSSDFGKITLLFSSSSSSSGSYCSANTDFRRPAKRFTTGSVGVKREHEGEKRRMSDDARW